MDEIFSFKNRRLGRQAALISAHRLSSSGDRFRWSGGAKGASVVLNIMNKSPRRDHPGHPPRRNERDCRKNGAGDGRWAFNLASESLFSLGTTDKARRVAYRTADGQLRFLPLQVS